jgi:hypothetical protein
MERPERRFWFILARTFGCTVDELSRRIGSREFSEWQRFYRLDPWGPERLDLGAATIASTVAAGSGAKCSPTDFMPDFSPPPPEPLADKLHRAFSLISNRA